MPVVGRVIRARPDISSSGQAFRDVRSVRAARDRAPSLRITPAAGRADGWASREDGLTERPGPVPMGEPRLCSV
jgi:hypothetical protein